MYSSRARTLLATLAGVALLVALFVGIGAATAKKSEKASADDKATASQGDRGRRGPRGIRGPRGFSGPAGPAGVAGPQGASGPQGPASGIQGPPGEDGEDGVDGVDGEDGAPGTPGAPGAPGPGAVEGTLISDSTTPLTNLYNDGNLRIAGICTNTPSPRLTFYNLQNNGLISITYSEQPDSTTEEPNTEDVFGFEDLDFDSGDAESKSLGLAGATVPAAPGETLTAAAIPGAHGTFTYQQGTTLVSGFFHVKTEAHAGGVAQACVMGVVVI